MWPQRGMIQHAPSPCYSALMTESGVKRKQTQPLRESAQAYEAFRE